MENLNYSIHSRGPTRKALDIPFILDRIILYLRFCTGPINDLHSDVTFGLGSRPLDHFIKVFPLSSLLSCMLVSKSWAASVLPLLWSRFAGFGDLCTTMFGVTTLKEIDGVISSPAEQVLLLFIRYHLRLC